MPLPPKLAGPLHHGGVTFDYALRVEGQDRSFRRADHVNFFLRGIPTLYFYGGNDANYQGVADRCGSGLSVWD